MVKLHHIILDVNVLLRSQVHKLHVFLLDAVNLQINRLLMFVDELLLFAKDGVDQLLMRILNPLSKVWPRESALHFSPRHDWQILQSCQRGWQGKCLSISLGNHRFVREICCLFHCGLCLWDRYLHRLTHHQRFHGFGLHFQRLGGVKVLALERGPHLLVCEVPSASLMCLLGIGLGVKLWRHRHY